MRGRSIESSGTRRWRPSHPVLAIGLIYLVFVSFKFHHFLEIVNALSGDGSFSGLDRPVNDLTSRHLRLGHRTPVLVDHDTFHRRLEDSRNLPPALEKEQPSLRFPPIKPFQRWFGHKSIGNLTQLQAMINEAWVLGQKAWDDVKKYDPMNSTDQLSMIEGKLESCPSSVAKSSTEMGSDAELLVSLPCGLAAGSSITVVGKPQEAHKEHVTKLARMRQGDGSGTTWVSQFVVELQGLRVVDGEDPPKILHLNPRLTGDWSKKPVLELNSCYRMQWGTAIRCNGLPSGDDDDTVTFVLTPSELFFSIKCNGSVSRKRIQHLTVETHSWMSLALTNFAAVYTVAQSKSRLFVLTMQAGFEGYQIFVGGRHVASFPYRPNLRKEVNTMLKKEAEYFQDIVILPFMDRYELVVLKTIAICDYGVHNLTTPYIMKCDDDTFIRVDVVLKEIKRVSQEKPLYMGNLNLLHRPLRHGKWAVSYEEWPGYIYPPYANGPGYIISIDIAKFIDSQHANQSLRVRDSIP
ncbi:hypothetical protein C4D60_Mb11t12790 [Musa balbisiana]|uniref:Galectin domain-containing protein n=1 Tax=Musa balbisiana TaxID=52838 RepID=A0A4S8J643_MUSBA|nr:hypothetical protein C4D60_Mb11t12790 [Musa balbisiana]